MSRLHRRDFKKRKKGVERSKEEPNRKERKMEKNGLKIFKQQVKEQKTNITRFDQTDVVACS